MNEVENEKNFVTVLVNVIKLMGTTPTHAEIRQKAETLADTIGYIGDLKFPIQQVLQTVDSRMGKGVSLINIDSEHDREWVFKRQDQFKWEYYEAYESYLRSQKGFHPNIVQSVSDVSLKILGHLQDPTCNAMKWDRRGLVIGHVQSGKTANYLSVIARAADAGYKFIVVIAGIHNILRTQTQERVDEGFVGRSSNPNERNKVIGVGLTKKNYPFPVTLTNTVSDFNGNFAAQSGWQLNDFSKPIVLVIKKNVNTLDTLYEWLRELNVRGGDQIADVPMLFIDDESDYASINTNRKELDPTRTNEMIRNILALFEKSCYVGYTATPFANIFINPQSTDDLFPRDFIFCLDAPNIYFGPKKVFYDDSVVPSHVIPIIDAELYLPFSHKKFDHVSELPPSLYQAIDQFFIARAIRNVRKQKRQHSSMMINASRFVNIQRRIFELVSRYVNDMKNAVRFNYADPNLNPRSNKLLNNLYEAYLDQFDSTDIEWNQIKKELNGVFEYLRIYLVNSDSEDRLDYKNFEKDNIGLTAIVIGGISLSRGLTIEGLSISYLYRNTRMYDTLMQMGRWFGYRLGYEDLCRIHLSPDSIDWYGHIADASEELRHQIRRMSRDGQTPNQFGLYVRSHPDTLLITARNKMREGEPKKVKMNFSGKLVESYILSTDDNLNKKNEELIAKYWGERFGTGKIAKTDKGWFIKDSKTSTIENFLRQFFVHHSFKEKKSAVSEYLRLISIEKYPVSDVLLISRSERDEDPSKFRLGTQKRKCSRIENAWRTTKDRVASKGDEKLGLTETQIRIAKQQFKDRISIETTKNSDEMKPSDLDYREVRNKPLLMLHSLRVYNEDISSDKQTIPAFGVSFPFGEYTTEVEVVVNKVWINQMHGTFYDTPADDEEFDD